MACQRAGVRCKDPVRIARLGTPGRLRPDLSHRAERRTSHPGVSRSPDKLVFDPGLIVGHMVTSCDGISAGVESRMTGGIKGANAGGTIRFHITNMGIKALILEDHPGGRPGAIVDPAPWPPGRTLPAGGRHAADRSTRAGRRRHGRARHWRNVGRCPWGSGPDQPNAHFHRSQRGAVSDGPRCGHPDGPS